jgi:hypothetical protein
MFFFDVSTTGHIFFFDLSTTGHIFFFDVKASCHVQWRALPESISKPTEHCSVESRERRVIMLFVTFQRG